MLEIITCLCSPKSREGKTRREEEKLQRRFLDVVKNDMQIVDVTEEDSKLRKKKSCFSRELLETS